MRQFIITFISLITYFSVSGQEHFETFEKNGKYGLKDLDYVLLKPKYDSLRCNYNTLSGLFIITAYKGKKIFYFDDEGNKIHKGNAKGSFPFRDGTGIIQRRNGTYDLIDSNGNAITRKADLSAPPKRYGRFVEMVRKEELVKDQITESIFLYSDAGLLEYRIQSIDPYQQFLVTSNETEIGELSYRVYHQNNGALIADDVSSFKDTLDHLFLKQYDQTTTLYNKESALTTRGLHELTLVDNTYFQDDDNGTKTLYKWESHQVLIHTLCDSFVFMPNTIYALGETNEQGQKLEIYDYKGTSLQKELHLLYALEDSRWIFSGSEGQFIANEDGTALSDYFVQISPFSVNGYRQVFEKYRYTYMNDETYATLTKDFPIIYQLKGSSGGNIFSALAQVFVAIMTIPIAAVLAPLTGGRSFEILNHLSPAEQQKYRVASPTDTEFFSEGKAVVCTYGMENDSSMVIGSDGLLYYNYIDTVGNFMNDTKYQSCYPFREGKAWIKDEKDKCYLITPDGKPANKKRFDSIRMDENGFMICAQDYTSSFFIFSSTYSKYILYSPENKALHKKQYYSIFIKDGAYYGRNKNDREELIYHLPKNDSSGN